jgi:hypothetical protein
MKKSSFIKYFLNNHLYDACNILLGKFIFVFIFHFATHISVIESHANNLIQAQEKPGYITNDIADKDLLNESNKILIDTSEEYVSINERNWATTNSIVIQDETREFRRIQPWSENPRYWQYKGEPVMLLGGADQDNLFNHPNMGPDGLEAHLDLLVSVGGNYVRNTMSSRDRVDSESDLYNDNNLYPFYRDEQTGLYDLDRWDETYWQQFRDFLEMTAQRDIIVQIEIWDRWDVGPDRYPAYVAYGWSAHPFNPKNNLNYSVDETNLDEEIWQGFPIFRTTPELDDVPIILSYQEAFVDKMLSISLDYDHILYCISNESTSSEEWSRHWAKFVENRAGKEAVSVEITEMWDNWDLTNPMHLRTFNHPDLYSYVDISQNNHQERQVHWDNMQSARKIVDNPSRPMNNIKIYGGERHGGGLIEGVHKFWRGILGGNASVRFHRPGRVPGYYGAGLSELAQTQIRSARMFEEVFDMFRARPDVDSSLLSDRQENEAYLAYVEGKQYAVYFPDGGSVKLDLSGAEGRFDLRWLDISGSRWTGGTTLQSGNMLDLRAPGEGLWMAVISLEM